MAVIGGGSACIALRVWWFRVSRLVKWRLLPQFGAVSRLGSPVVLSWGASGMRWRGARFAGAGWFDCGGSARCMARGGRMVELGVGGRGVCSLAVVDAVVRRDGCLRAAEAIASRARDGCSGDGLLTAWVLRAAGGIVPCWGRVRGYGRTLWSNGFCPEGIGRKWGGGRFSFCVAGAWGTFSSSPLRSCAVSQVGSLTFAWSWTGVLVMKVRSS